MKKKILYIAEAFGGGVFTYFTELANAVAEEYEVLIAYAKRAETPENFERFFRSDMTRISSIFIPLRQVFAEEWRLTVKNTESIIHRMAMLF